ncbi:MarR family winged helix-turn-helix transcriptional regulator [Xanthomonas citri]|uniref:MarR family winged helix-turn-helix transcriptional regulator n=1 Tax=Xanthomonas citri TaxID=346 RepID=UPI001CBF64A5|nr:MarR family winged helix-turn-helix transcriptional regulator [Xanthomonas citri]
MQLKGQQPRFIYLLSVAHRRVEAAIEREGVGMTAARAGLLLALQPDREVPMLALGQMLSLGAPAMSGLIERTIKSGLAKRRRDDNDGRAWLVSLTPAGVKMRVEVAEGARKLNTALTEGFTQEELAIAARWLESVRRPPNFE